MIIIEHEPRKILTSVIPGLLNVQDEIQRGQVFIFADIQNEGLWNSNSIYGISGFSKLRFKRSSKSWPHCWSICFLICWMIMLASALWLLAAAEGLRSLVSSSLFDAGLLLNLF